MVSTHNSIATDLEITSFTALNTTAKAIKETITVLLCIVGIVHWSCGIRKCLEVSHFLPWLVLLVCLFVSLLLKEL